MVESIRLEVLRGSHIDAATLRGRFEILAAGTPLAGATVVVHESHRDAPGDVAPASITVRD